jgi:hypothetical protein
MPPVESTESVDPVGEGHSALMVASTGSSHTPETHLFDSARYTLRSDDTGSDGPDSTSHSLTPQLSTEEENSHWPKPSKESNGQECRTAGRQGPQIKVIAKQSTPQLPIISQPNHAWEARKQELRRLYLDENMPLISVAERMRQQGFAARYSNIIYAISGKAIRAY